jgi:glyoxylase-like metal-dependent hydrolase (beta-lactamase superfamily II)
MHMLSGGRLRMRKSTYFPDADRSEMLELPVSCVLLRHPTGNVLFDTGCHPDVASDPEGRWGAMARFMTPIMPVGQHVLEGLKAVGLTADDISIVICSHLHTDHCGCNQFFHKARILVRSEELETAKAPNASDAGFLRSDWDHPLRYEAVSGEADLFDDGSIKLVHLPGHTAGLMGALVTLRNAGRFLLASDAVSIRANLDTDVIPKNTWNKELCRESFKKIRAIESQGATVICGHDDAQWSSLRKATDYYD